MSTRKVHWLDRGTVTVCGIFAGFEGVTVSDRWQEATCLKCTRPSPSRMAELHREALILNQHVGLPRECPDGSGRVAPAGQHWSRNLLSGTYVLEYDGTPFTSSVASETYWSS